MTTRQIVGEPTRDSSEPGGRPRVSFVVPAHDEEALLPRTLAALRAAGERAAGGSFEIVVADDASSDRTGEIAASLGARVVRIEARRIAAARNAGARAARGEVLVFVDADTVVPAETLAAALRAIESERAAGGGATVAFDGRIPLWARAMLGVLMPLLRLFRASGGCFIFARRDAYERTGGWDESLLCTEEMTMCRDLRRQGRFVVLRETVVTSGRKLRTHSAREIFCTLVAIGVRGRRGARDPKLAGLWYGPRREDPVGTRLDEAASE